MDLLSLDKALYKVFEENIELLRTNRDGFLQKVREICDESSKSDVDIMYPALCEDAIEIIYGIYASYQENGMSDSVRRKVRLGIEEIVDILKNHGVVSDIVLKTIIHNFFSIVGLAVNVSSTDKYDASGTKNGIDIVVNLSSPKIDPEVKGKKRKEWIPTYPEQILFYIWFCVVMCVWTAVSVVVIIAMVLQVANGTFIYSDGINWNYVASSGIVVLLIVAGKWFMPLMKESFDSSVRSKNKNQEVKWNVVVSEASKMQS